MLDANGMEADIFTDDVLKGIGNMSGIRLMVKSDDRKKAKELLKNIE